MNKLFLLAIPLVLLINLILLSAPILLPSENAHISSSSFTSPSPTLTSITTSSTTSTAISSTTTTISEITCNSVISYIYPVETFPVSIPVSPTYYFSLPYCPLSSQQSGSYAYSPTAIVNASNSANAIWLLTSPSHPKQAYTNDYLFTPYKNFTGGDVCFAYSSPLYPTVTYDIVANGPTPYNVSIQNFYIHNIGELDLLNLGYSPLVDDTLSNGFNTKSYIFDQVPSYAQHGLWAWAAKYAELSGISNTMEISYVYIHVNTTTCYYPNGTVASVDTIYTPLTANMYVTMNNLNNTFIPYNVVTGENSYTTFNTPILPYILYNFSMPSPGSLNLPMYMNVSYDTFSPWSYNEPQNSIEPFPIDTGSRFFVNYNGVLANSNPNEITKMPWINFTNWLSKIPNLNHIPNYISPSISGVISIAAAPNNYIYLLNYSSSQGAYFLTMLRLIPKGYYNTTNYQPDSVGSANSEQQWYNKWNSYWANVIALQNSSVYVVSSINLDTFNNSFLSDQGFQPLNISVDNFGDVFITGSSFFGPALAEITNTLVNNNWAEVYNSIETNPNNQVMSEIAVSPTGSLIFLANQNDGGYIYVYSSPNFTQINKINLAYAFYPGGSSGGIPLATLNIYSWLSNDGLYNQSLSNVLDNFFVNKVMVLDTPEYHHPLGLADINGYLYVLDEWAGDIGVSSSSSWLGLFKNINGVFFNILTLRVVNSTGSNIPINPTHFNDMYTVQSCGSPIYQQEQALKSDECYPINNYFPGNVMCSSNCELVADSCYIYRTPGYKYSCISANTLSSTYYSLAPPYYSIGNAYPPYGWILAANITGAQLSNIVGTALYSVDNAKSINFCGGNDGTPPVCNFNPVNLNPANYHSGVNYYNGSYYPIGPQLDALAMHGKYSRLYGLFGSYSDTAARTSSDIKVGWAPEYNKMGFSVNFNDSVDILFPNSTPKNPLHDIGVFWGLISETIKNPNIYKELILTKLNVENYTKLFGGLPPYNCLTSYSYYQNTVCGYMPGVEYMNPPVYTAADAFKYLESLGTPQIMPIEGVVYSTYSGNGPSSSVCGISIKEAEQNITNGNIINSSTCGPVSANEVVLNSYNSISSSSSSLYIPSPIVESLNSKLAGYILIPYTYNVYIYNSILTLTPTFTSPIPIVNSYQVFTYQTVGSSSNNFDSTIEGGDTYLMYSNGTYYVPHLSDYRTILSKSLITNLITNRNFANIYVNVTDQTGLFQIIANGSKTASFTINQYYLGSQPVYETISSVPESGVLFGESALSTLISEPYKIFGAALGQGTGYYYQQFNVPSLIHLFNWYKMGLFTDALDLYLNQSPLNPSGTTLSSGAAGPSFNTRGYTRLIYVLNDRFNNTIYLPIDADIANITQIRLNVKSVVDPSNANQTTLYITGNATYFDGVKYVPLADNSIYIYFNNNINYMQYNALLYPVNAILCAYNSMVSGPCTLANPAFTSLSQNANVITYYPQYNASGECGPPPTHLYNPPVYNCNIYGNGLPATCNSIVLQSGQEITQWCIPLAYNGMGVCTSQIGLMGIATTDSNGNFSFTANACGIGTASITAEFYGYPYNEPATVTQPYLSNSATLYYDLEGGLVNNVPSSLATFQVLNYTWSPNETTLSPVTLGLSELSYGSISIIWLLGLAAIAIILMYITARSKKD
ncbi:MAG: hypothetical protein RXO35_03830 [Candidatus Micrarchaeota archaeon]